MFESILSDNSIDATRVYNLEETGVTLNRDNSGRCHAKRLLRQGKASSSQIREAHFSYTHRVKIMCCVYAKGKASSLFIVIRGTEIPFRLIEVNNRWEVDYLHQFLPKGSLFTFWKEMVTLDRHKSQNGLHRS